MNIKRIIFGTMLVSLLSICKVNAALPSLSGGSGLVISRTTDVLRRGNFNTSLFLTTNIYSISSDSIWPDRPTEIAPTLSFNYGVLDTFEVGLLMPFSIGAGVEPRSGSVQVDSTKDSGLGKIKLIVKWAYFPNSVHTRTFNFGLTGYAGLPTATSKFIGSDSFNAGIEVNTAFFYGKTKQFGTYLNFGIENGDQIFEPCPGGGAICTFEGEVIDGMMSGLKLVGAFGFDYYPVKKVGIVFETIGSSFRKTEDEDFYAVVGAKYIPTKNLAFDGGVGIGLPPDQVKPNTDYTITVGASYIFGKGKETPAPKAPAPKVSKPVKMAKPAPVKPPEVTPAAKAARLMVLNGCATGNAAEPAAKLLQEKGYVIAKIAAVKEKTFKETQIRFPKEFTKDAVEISRLLPGKQQMARMAARSDADLMVIAGCDQLEGTQPATPSVVPPPAPAPVAPPPPAPVEKKSLKDMRVVVMNACGKAGVGEDAAKKLLLDGYNITKVGTADIKGAKVSEVKYIGIYEKEVDTIVGKLGIKAKKSPDQTLKDAEIAIYLGCDYKVK